MPKRSSKADPNQLAKSIVDRATGQTVSEDAMRQVMREMGRRGGLKGGKARADKLSRRRRSEIAKEAANKRWAKNSS